MPPSKKVEEGLTISIGLPRSSYRLIVMPPSSSVVTDSRPKPSKAVEVVTARPTPPGRSGYVVVPIHRPAHVESLDRYVATLVGRHLQIRTVIEDDRLPRPRPGVGGILDRRQAAHRVVAIIGAVPVWIDDRSDIAPPVIPYQRLLHLRTRRERQSSFIEPPDSAADLLETPSLVKVVHSLLTSCTGHRHGVRHIVVDDVRCWIIRPGTLRPCSGSAFNGSASSGLITFVGLPDCIIRPGREIAPGITLEDFQTREPVVPDHAFQVGRYPVRKLDFFSCRSDDVVVRGSIVTLDPGTKASLQIPAGLSVRMISLMLS